jgi:putative nucleotidyltransferase with HDIG domain
MAPKALKSLYIVVGRFHPLVAVHSRKVAGLSAGLAAWLGVEGAGMDPETARLAGFFHDLGKLGCTEILDSVLPVSDDERLRMRGHPLLGYEVLRAAGDVPAAVLEAALHHHERWDGRGYPFGLAGQSIPLAARVVGLCDAYEAMVSARPWREPRTHREAVLELRAGAGTQFDPSLVDPLVEYVTAQLEQILQVMSSAVAG